MPVIILVAALVAAAAAPLHAAGETGYQAVFADGTRLQGERITGWGEHPGVPQLDNTSLQDPKRPLRWLRNLSLKPWRKPEAVSGYIEFVGGDRIVGRVVGARPSSDAGGVHTPAHLLVTFGTRSHSRSHSRWRWRSRSKTPNTVRVLIDGIRRIVMTPTPRPSLRTGALWYRDSRRVDFVGVRPGSDSLRLLLSDGSLSVQLDNVAEVNFPQVDPWDAHFRTLGILSPACRSTLVRFETTDGLIATGSELRFRALPYANEQLKQQALEHLKRAEENLARLQKVMKEQTEKFDQAHAEYSKQSGELEKQRNAPRQAYDKAKADLRRRIDQQKKKDADLLTEKRAKIDREFKSADADMVKRLAAEKPEKRDAMLKAFRRKQDRLRKTREQAVENERAKLDRQRLKELADSDTREMKKLKLLKADFEKRSGQIKAQFAKATAEWERHSRSINHARSQRAAAMGAYGSSETWYHVIQPVWSLDALRIPFKSICMRWSFEPRQLPLSMIRPTASVNPPLQPWRADRGAGGRFLHSGGRKYCWGFGVHAYSELSFTLPRCVNSFQAQLGLDRVVAEGGCAQARVFLGSTDQKPLYASEMLIGSKKTVATGPIAIGSAGDGPRRLILQADTAHHGRPKGTDPLNIRDKLNWLEPVVGFEAAGLQEAVQREAVKQLHAWRGWTVKFDKRGVYTWTTHFWEDKSAGQTSFLPMIRAEKHPLVFSRKITVGPRDNWLAVDAGVFSAENAFRPQNIAIRIDNKEIRPEPLPIRQDWQTRDAARSFAIGPYRGKEVTIEMTQPAGGPSVYWYRASISNDVSGEYRLAGVLKKAGKADMKVQRGLGWGLQSDALDDAGRLALLDIDARGAVVNFWNPAVKPIGPSELANVLIGDKWTGGDKGLETVAKVGGLKQLFLAGDAGVSAAAVEKLRAQRPDLVISPFDRTPSAYYGRCRLVLKNLCDKDVVVYWVHFNGKLVRTWAMKPNASVHHNSVVGGRYEAHIDDKVIATYTVVPATVAPAQGAKAYVVWEIKRK